MTVHIGIGLDPCSCGAQHGHESLPWSYLAVDADTGEIAAHVLTEGHADDAAQVLGLLGQVERVIPSVAADGAYDGQISTMVRASGYEIVKVGSKRPEDLIAALLPGEVVPMATIADNEAHITLLWKDARGVVRLYDSDDIHGSHVLPRGSALYRARVDDPRSEWSLAEKYR